jgi:hypothetical protein
LKKKCIFLFLFAWSFAFLYSQEIVPSTNYFTISGEVTKETRVTLADIEKLPTHTIPDVIITNHKGEKRSTLQKARGVLVKDLLNNIALKNSNPKLFSEYYFVFVASDDYKVVYSWNELFNSPTGDHLYFVTGIADKPIQTLKERILTVSVTDYKTGRRYMKGLTKIIIHKVN